LPLLIDFRTLKYLGTARSHGNYAFQCRAVLAFALLVLLDPHGEFQLTLFQLNRFFVLLVACNPP
jgi:hypothetical protein